MTVFQTQIYTLVKIELESKFYYNHLQKNIRQNVAILGHQLAQGNPQSKQRHQED